MLLLQRELLEDALAVAREACELAEETDVLILQADTLVALGRVLHARDDREGAERAIRGAERRYEAKGASSQQHGFAASGSPRPRAVERPFHP